MIYLRARTIGLSGMFRANIVLKHYRGFEMPEGAKFNAWLHRLFEHPAFKSTCSTDELYLDSYERRARSRPLCLFMLLIRPAGMPSTDRTLAKSRMRSTLGGLCLDCWS